MNLGALIIKKKKTCSCLQASHRSYKYIIYLNNIGKKLYLPIFLVFCHIFIWADTKKKRIKNPILIERKPKSHEQKLFLVEVLFKRKFLCLCQYFYIVRHIPRKMSLYNFSIFFFFLTKVWKKNHNIFLHLQLLCYTTLKLLATLIFTNGFSWFELMWIKKIGMDIDRTQL